MSLLGSGTSFRSRVWGAAATGLAAAALFGASTPIAKLLLPVVEPLILAGLLYLGAGLGLLAIAPLRGGGAESSIKRSDLPALAGMIVMGGIAGPILLVLGLARLSATASSLLLNLETPLTIALAIGLFHEQLSRREAVGAGAVVAGGAVLTWAPGSLELDPVGVACIVGACAAWALDNNLSRRLSIRDPIAVARTKTLIAGAFNVALAFAFGERLPDTARIGAVLLTGSLGYGASIVLHLLALRSLGAARQSALFATAPFIGVLVAMLVLRERLTVPELAAGGLMAMGIAVLIRTRHAHQHRHEPLQHEHTHVHDEHHAHEHPQGTVEPHSHPHAHVALVHDHPHLPDVHHRHPH
jgi:drug/metabolite transporter (DMT)-like permease